MPLVVKILLSVFAGWIVAAVLLVLSIYLNDPFWSPLLIWHWKPIYALAGDGPFLGYNTAGEPIYEGTPIHFLSNIIGMMAGFVIYPIIFLLVTNLPSFVSRKRSIEGFSAEPPLPPTF